MDISGYFPNNCSFDCVIISVLDINGEIARVGPFNFEGQLLEGTEGLEVGKFKFDLL